MATVTMYSKGWCPYCTRARGLLAGKGATVEVIDIEARPDQRAVMIERSGRSTVPQIFMDGKIFVEGGWTGLSNMTAEDIVTEIDLRHSLADQTL